MQQDLGRVLFEHLFAGKVGRRFEQSLAKAGTLRLRLVFDPDHEELVHVAALPWELLRNDETRDLLGRDRKTLLVRYVETGRAIEPLEVHGRLRVLVASCAPKNLRPVESRAERERIWKALGEKTGVEVDVVEQPDLGTLRRRLLDGAFHVLHFIGHGGFDNDTGEGSLAFVASDGEDQYVPGDTFADHVKGTELQVVVLSSCYGATLPRRRGQSVDAAVAPALLRAGVPAVVAMQLPISDEAAITFSESFYTALAHNDDIDVAVVEGRLGVSTNAKASLEWATPALFLRVADGKLFSFAEPAAQELTPAPVTANSAPPSPRTPRTPRPDFLHLGVRSFRVGWGEGMEDETDRMLALEEHFGERHILDHTLWHTEVFPALRDFFSGIARERGRPIHLDFAAHLSIAFATGYLLDAKSGLDVRVSQRGQRGTSDMWARDASPPDRPLWRFEKQPGTARCNDVAVAVSVTWPIDDDVRAYLRASGLSVGRVLHASVLPEPGGEAVDNGAHALRLAQLLGREIRARTVPERRGVLHLFISAPNIFTFFLGQIARNFGRVQLYEHELGSVEPGAYRPGLWLPPE